MTVTDFILVVVIAAILGVAIGYIIMAKKSGIKCIGCPSAKACKAAREERKKDCCCNCK